jgi:3-oxoacyl-(acyl-carrier-protein) synthase
MGLVTAQGVGVEASWRGVVQGADRLAPWTGIDPSHPLSRLKVAACAALPRPADLPARLWQRLSRTQQLACVAADEALLQSRLGRQLDPSLRPRSGLFFATTVCGMDVNERFYASYREDPDHADTALMRRIPPAETEVLLARRHRFGADVTLRNLCLSTCVGSAVAIGAAMDAINLGECDLALVGGSEALCRVVLSGFHALKVVAPEGCRPFDRNRPGITVGEGAGVLVLESPDHARRRGAPVLAHIRGFGATCDAHHLTAPDPQGIQATRAISEALQRAGIAPSAIDYINAHGTGTRDNDATEAHALQRIFSNQLPPVSSTKRATGHTFGAAGAVEAILCVQAIRESTVPPNAGSIEPDPALWNGPDPVARSATPRNINAALSTNFAFGGNNTALVFAREAAHA